MPNPHDHYRDSDGRTFRLVTRVDPVGDTPAYWQVRHLDTGRVTTIREDRLTDAYTPVSVRDDDAV